ncbi:MAG: DUF389 domain-containing protein [Hyphomonadaceae bacterium]
MADAQTPEASPKRRSLGQWLAMLRRLLVKRLSAEEAVDVRTYVDQEGRLSGRYLLMCALSAGIATLGLLQSSSAVVIGAMLVSPLMSPIAKLGFSFASLDGRRAQEAAGVLAIGCGLGMLVGVLLTGASPIRNPTPEIIARTAPTLLDLAVAILSGLAGGYATVHRRGETAIGVAIATALMPPLATVGYGIAVARWDFAGGALLLFLTNLAAISFSFALMARMFGVARPLARVDFKWRYVAIGVAAFLILATPLALSLRQLARETAATLAARQEITEVLGIDPTQIAQLSVSWSADKPKVVATIITSQFSPDAESHCTSALTQRLRAPVDMRLQQIVAADPTARTQELVEAALAEHQSAQLAAAGAAPLAAARAASRARIAEAWAVPGARALYLLAAPAPDWDLHALHREEQRLASLGFDWSIRLIPPYQQRAPILFGDNAASLDDAEPAQAVADVAWALERWGVRTVVVEGMAGARAGATRALRELAARRAANVAAYLNAHGVTATTRIAPRATSAQLAREGAARVRAADILAFQ